MTTATAPRTGAERVAAHVSRHNACARREVADQARRTALEADPLAWCAHYMPGAFPKPFGDIHRQIARAFREAVDTGGWCVVAAPRSSGKTTLVNALALKAVLSGQVRFVAVIPWRQADAGRALRFWRTAICSNTRLLADYPDICAPFAACRMSSQRLLAIHWADEDAPTGAQMVLSEGLIVLPGSAGVLGSASINGNPRGMQFTLPDQTTIRPDMLLVDDPSDKTTARSRDGSERNVEFIKEDVVGMAGPGEKIAAVMTGSTIAAHDTLAHFLGDNEPDWVAVKVPQITVWPTEPNMELWERWNVLRLEGREDDMTKARKFYVKHGEQMREGMAVSWEHRFSVKHKEPDAYWSAMADYYRMGRKAFLQERQNKPEEEAAGLLVLTQDQVAERTGTHRRREWPEDATILVAGIDVGTATALNWCVVAATPQLAVHVAEYGTYPPGNQPLWTPKSSQTSQSAITAGLGSVVQMLMRMFPNLKAIGIDGNYATQVVYAFAKQAREQNPGVAIVPCRGVPSGKFKLPQLANRHKLRAMGDQCHGYRGDKGEEVWFNSHHWHRLQQEGFTIELGAPGSVQLPIGGRHEAMAMAVCADQLIRVEIRGDGKEIQVWEQDRRYENHLSDALVMAMVQANLEGASTNGPVEKARVAKPKRPTDYGL